MAYFIVAPLFLAWLAACGVGLLLLRIKAPAWPGRPYAFHAVVWSSAGVLAANALFIACLALAARWMQVEAEGEGLVPGLLRAVWSVGAILGPLVASAAGWFAGLLAGLAFAHTRGGRLGR